MDCERIVAETMQRLSSDPDLCVIAAQLAGAEIGPYTPDIPHSPGSRATILREYPFVRMWYDPEWIQRVTFPERAYTFGHEALHLILQHDEWAVTVPAHCVKRMKCAADMAVESVMRNAPFGSPAVRGESHVYAEKYGLPPGLTAGQYFRRLEGIIPDQPLPEDPYDDPGPSPEGGDEGGEGDDPGDEGSPQPVDGGGEDQEDEGGEEGEGSVPCFGSGDEIADFLPADASTSTMECDDTTKDLMPQILSGMAAGVGSGMAQGGLAGALQGLQVANRSDWTAKLMRFLEYTFVKQDRSYARPARRHLWRGLIMPSPTNKQAVGDLVVFIDCSGSMPDLAVRKCYEMLNDLVKHHVHDDNASVTIGQFSAGFAATPETHRRRQFPLKFVELHGRGNTYVAPCFEWLAQSPLKPCGVVVFSDGGIADIEKALEPRFPVLWVIDGRFYREPQFGQTLYVS